MLKSAICSVLMVWAPLLIGTAVAGRQRKPAAPLPSEEIGGKGFPEMRARLFPQLFAPDECDRILKLAEGVAEKVGALGGDDGEGMRQNEQLRTSRVRFLANNRKRKWVYTRVLQAAKSANEAKGWGLGSLESVEHVQVGVYHSSEAGHYNWHADAEERAATDRDLRILSISVQLTHSGDYSGGDLQIGLLNVSRERGHGVIFASNQKHRVHPVTSGSRYSLVAWVQGRPSPAFWGFRTSSTDGLLRKAYRITATKNGGIALSPPKKGLAVPALLRSQLLAQWVEQAWEQHNWARLKPITAEVAKVLQELVSAGLGSTTDDGGGNSSMAMAFLLNGLAWANLKPTSRKDTQAVLEACTRAAQLFPAGSRYSALAKACQAKWGDGDAPPARDPGGILAAQGFCGKLFYCKRAVGGSEL